MKISKVGIDLIKSFEGCYLHAYKCPAGVWTIGYGHTASVDGKAIGAGMQITHQKAEELLAACLEKRYEPAVRKLGELNQNQYDALVSFCYNLGPNIFKGNLLNAINAQNWDSVANQMLLYNKGGGKVLSGLTKRRKAERDLFVKEMYIVQEIKIKLNGVDKTVKAINKDGNNYVRLQDLRDGKIEIGYEGVPIVKVKG